MRNPDLRRAYEAIYEGSRKEGESAKSYADRMAKKYFGKKSKTYDPMEDPNFDHDKAERTRGSMEEETNLSEEGKKDACYHKVKSRYSVWPSAYASGALVKCRKKGAKNWGNSAKKEDLEMVFAFLINEGFASSEDDALAILEGMSDTWFEMIMEDLTEEFG